MPPQHPTEAARQQARNILASMPPARRAFLEALHAEYFPPRADWGQPYPVADLLAHLAWGAHYGWEDEKIAPALQVPADYFRMLREAAGLETPGESKAGGADDLPHR
jgi:hypothetical protein